MRWSLLAAVVVGGFVVSADDAVAQTVAQPARKTPAKAAAKAEPAAEGAEAEAPPKAAAVKRKDPAEAQRQIDAGVQLLKAGKAEPAIQTISGAIAGGNLPPQILAKAHYHRGSAYRKASKPAQAIGDFTNALWLKGGLTEAERNDALEQRSAAYREAGLPDQSDSEGRPAGGRAKPAAAERTAAAAPAAQPAEAASGGLFGNLFGGSTQPAAVQTAPAPTPAPAAKSPPAAPDAATSAWSSATQIKQGRRVAPAVAPVAVAIPPPPVAAPQAVARAATVTTASAAPTAAAAAAPAGRFGARVALVRSKIEADAIVGRLKSEFAAAIESRTPEVGQVAFGGMGAFFQVKVGPYSTQAAAQAACARLKGPGLDCVAVDR